MPVSRKPNDSGRTDHRADTPVFRTLPSVGSVVEAVQRAQFSTYSGDALVNAIQLLLDEERTQIAHGATPQRDEIMARVLARLRSDQRPRLQPVINATGVLIHTNLGRAPVSQATAEAMAAVARAYVPLEIDVETNQRGGRMREIVTLMRLLTGAEASVVVNNNAAAVLLVLSSIAAGHGVIVSRGEAVEIGGGFRIPDVMVQSSAKLVEVGTTNRTYAHDYERAIDDTTAAILKVHPSNFQLSGFVHAASIADLAPIAVGRGIPLIEDLGSGALLDTTRFGLAPEPTIAESLKQGATIITASGDKLLGGPQAGIIAGSRDWMERIARHPLARAVRADKTCLAGVAATLRHFARGDAVEQVPIWRMIAASKDSLRRRASELAMRLRAQGIVVKVIESEATVGGGSLPGQVLPSAALALADLHVDDLSRRLRIGQPAVFGRIEDGLVVLDLRSVLPEDDADLVRTVGEAVAMPAVDPSSPENPDYHESTGWAED